MTSLFGKPAAPQIINNPAPLPLPTVTAPAVMPDTNSPAAIEAQRRAQADVLNRAGRTSTILTAPGNRGNSSQKPNYDTYSAVKTGTG